MKFIVKCNVRWDNGYFYYEMSMNEIMNRFVNENEDVELDLMVEKVMNLNIGNSYTHHFFMNDSYTFMRVI